MCAKHFSPSQYSRYPSRLAELGYPNARAQLKDDAVPDIPWAINKESDTSKSPRSYGAYRKRRRLEVLEELMKEEENIIDVKSDSSQEEPVNVQQDDTPTDTSTFKTSTADKAVQVFIRDTSSKVKKRTRRIQAGRSLTNFKTADSQVQCDEIRLICNCMKSMDSREGFQSVKSTDRGTYMVF